MGGTLVLVTAELLSALRRDEQLRLVAYDDATGKPWQPGTPLLGFLTIAYGRNLSAMYPQISWKDLDLSYDPDMHGRLLQCTQDEAEDWLLEDATKACQLVDKYLPWTSQLDQVRLEVLQNMMFNMGPHGMLEFHNTLYYAQIGQYYQSSYEMEQSRWHVQTKDRAVRLEVQMRTGTRH